VPATTRDGSRFVRPSELELQAARGGDAEPLAELRDEAARWLLARGYQQWEVGEYTAAQFAEAIERDEVLVVREGGRVVASLTIVDDDPFVWSGLTRADAAYVHRLVVARSHAGRGWGQAVLAAAEERLRQRCRTVVRLDYVASNDKLGELYRRLGYREVARREFPERPGIRPCVLMEKHLTEAPDGKHLMGTDGL
jgi:ribosomal protein S18 acetylase RimI-like enzyme